MILNLHTHRIPLCKHIMVAVVMQLLIVPQLWLALQWLIVACD